MWALMSHGGVAQALCWYEEAPVCRCHYSQKALHPQLGIATFLKIVDGAVHLYIATPETHGSEEYAGLAFWPGRAVAPSEAPAPTEAGPLEGVSPMWKSKEQESK